MSEKSLARDTATIGLLIALQIILTRFFPTFQTIRIDFAFVPIAICSMLYGPIKAGGAAALGDIIGVILYPSPFPYFPGFTFSAFLSGMIFGLFLYRKPKSTLRIAMPVVIIFIVKTLGLDTLWILMMASEKIHTLPPSEIINRIELVMPYRLIHTIMVPVQIVTLSLLWYALKPLESRFASVIENIRRM